MIIQAKAVSLIEPAINHSLSLLPSRTDDGDAVHGILAALKHVRISLNELGGYSTVSLLDTVIRDRLIVRNLRKHCGMSRPNFAMLPLKPRYHGVAETVMVATVDACLVYAGRETDLSGMILVVSVLLDRLVDALGQAPDPQALVEWLRNDASRDVDRNLLDDEEEVRGVLH